MNVSHNEGFLCMITETHFSEAQNQQSMKIELPTSI